MLLVAALAATHVGAAAPAVAEPVLAHPSVTSASLHARGGRSADAKGPTRRDARPPADNTSARAPSLPPLTSGALAGTEEDSASGSSQPGADPLVSNGLGSPLCRGALGAEELSAARERGCETSGFVGASAPTENFGLDVHIDTGFLGLSSGSVDRAIQDLLVTPAWMAIVWAVHALVVMLEWCFTIDLLDDASVELGSSLRAAQTRLTYPWLASVLAIAAIVTAYHGLIRRRVSDALGQALVAGTMMVAGLWVILDPSGTVGALGGWANQASLGTLAVAANGAPARAGRALGDSMAGVFAAAVEVPWCYLEFGDVGWCRNARRRDPRLYAAGLAIARRELAQASCRDEGSLTLCAPAGGAAAKALEHSAELLRSARTNGEIFLALPANGSQRNSINDESSLLRVMCQSSDATSCKGAMAAQAEFRTNAGTLQRVGGLLLIWGGVLGMLLIFGFIGLRLLGAAIFSLLYLLLAPAVVLAPALGEAGRAVFRRWAANLVGALVAKLLFGFLLGVLLTVLAMLAGLEALGWWTQWLLMSALWWGAYGRRHQVLSMAGGSPGERNASRSVSSRVAGLLEPPRKVLGAAGAIGRGLGAPARDPERRERIARTAARGAAEQMEAQARRLLERAPRPGVGSAGAQERQTRLAAKRAQLARIQREQARARAEGDRRRELELAYRARRVEQEVSGEEQRTAAGRVDPGVAERGSRRDAFRERELEQAKSFLDRQAALRAGVTGARPRRDYAALAGVIGREREEYERLPPARQRLVRAEIDRELALRNELPRVAGELARESRPGTVKRGDRQEASRALQEALRRRMRQPSPTHPTTAKFSHDKLCRT